MTSKIDALSPQSTKTITAHSWLVSAARMWGLMLLTLHLAAFRLPEASAWSVWPYTFLPPWLGWVLALLVGALIIPAVSQAVLAGLVWLQHRILSFAPQIKSRQAWFIIISLLSGLLFWIARLRHLSWGDSYLLSIALSYHDLDLRVIYNWQAPFTVFLHQRLWQFLADPILGWPVEHVYATTSILCGMLFVYIQLIFMSRLGRDRAEMMILTGLMVTTGSMQLFFGYVENYTIVSLCLLVTLFLAWRAVQGEIQLVWPVLGLSLTNAFHPSTVFLWPAMLLLSWLCWQRGLVSEFGSSQSKIQDSKSKIFSWLLQTLLPPLLVGGSVVALMESGGHGLSALLGVDRPGGGDGIWFVPLFETTTQWQQYTMFSAAHLLDWGNVHLLISPAGIPLIVLAMVVACRFQLTLFDSQAERDYAAFLVLMAFMYILLTWLWNPDYGGRKDWDLFAPSAFVYTLLAGYLFVRLWADKQQLKEIGLFVFAVSLLHTVSWIFTNTHNLPRA